MLAFDPPLQLQRQKCGGDVAGGHRQVADQLILGQRTGAKAGKNLGMQGAGGRKGHGCGDRSRQGRMWRCLVGK